MKDNPMFRKNEESPFPERNSKASRQIDAHIAGNFAEAAGRTFLPNVSYILHTA
jgi:hypothetical protein